ncbi:hypothetical protein CJJ23_02395 [Mycoplasmopsis agassizii]|uniref:Peptidase S8/S53 domain-containing protein n=1 Tax=Mycoplasmopsis agassizii TaxID=33922 RepID=A0A269TJ02_9BACT|nr:S8 family serine peptidase [Mycoplasmopsis agassizii]PAK21367.1 hypothetical protein CJJ23_02395 [Mycoplasmopsis agassizii]
MKKFLFTLFNNVSVAAVPLQTLTPVTQQFIEDSTFLNTIFKIERIGYSQEDWEKNIDQPVEVLVRLSENSNDSLSFDQLVEYYGGQNSKFVDIITKELVDIANITKSETSPFVTFTFKNRKNLGLNLVKLALNEKTIKVTSFETEATFDVEPISNSSYSTSTTINGIEYHEMNKKIFETVSVFNQMVKDNNANGRIINSHKPKIKVGVYEANATVYRNNPNFINSSVKNIHYYELTDKETNERVDLLGRGSSDHADKVASVITGKNGIDNYITDIYSTYQKKQPHFLSGKERKDLLSTWIRKIDWMIKNGVSVINNSWKVRLPMDTVRSDLSKFGYNEQAYYLDFIARKYGIINVIASGNDDQDQKYRSINSFALSHNSVVVGSTTEDGKKRSYFSEYETPDPKIQTKPLLVAPGENFAFSSTEHGTRFNEVRFTHSGTSFAAPIVTGLITTLLRHNPKLFKKPAAMLAVLTAGSKEMKGYAKNKTNGLNNEVGAGLINYEKMQKAADNVSFIDSYNFQNFTSKEIYLNKNDNLDISTAWLFNAGYIDIGEGKPVEPEDFNKRPDWIKDWNWLNFVPFGSFGYLGKYSLFQEDVKRWEQKRQKHLDELKEYNNSLSDLSSNKYDKANWKSIETMKKQFGNSWYTPIDIDLKLEKYNSSSGQWNTVVSSISSYSNVEFIRHKVTESGRYRIVVYKHGKVSSERTIGAVTYVVN